VDYLKCYQVLGMRPGSSLEQLHRAYKRLVLRHHPDRAVGDPASLETFHRVNEAYATLRDALRNPRRTRAGTRGRAWGPCPKCGRVAELFKDLHDAIACGDCLLQTRRRFLPLPTYVTIRCIPTIVLQSLGGYCAILSASGGDWRHAAAGAVSTLAGLFWLTYCVRTADVIVS
jgi:hypothetical protein